MQSESSLRDLLVEQIEIEFARHETVLPDPDSVSTTVERVLEETELLPEERELVESEADVTLEDVVARRIEIAVNEATEQAAAATGLDPEELASSVVVVVRNDEEDCLVATVGTLGTLAGTLADNGKRSVVITDCDLSTLPEGTLDASSSDVSVVGGASLSGTLTDLSERVRSASERASTSGKSAFVSGRRKRQRRQAKDFVGKVFDKKYKLLKLLGEGGFGAVFKAKDVLLDTEVAVKVMRPGPRRTQKMVDDFKREAQRVTKLSHQNIVEWKVLDETDDGIVYFVMELLEGEELAQTIERDGKLAPQRAQELMLQVLDALRTAHHLKGGGCLLHLDLKPQNVFLTEDAQGVERAKVIDFGIGQFAGEAPDREELDSTVSADGSEAPTGSGSAGRKITAGTGGSGVRRSAACTPEYAAPEQCGHMLSDVEDEPLDQRTDIYSFGVMAFQMLTGRLPFEKPENRREYLRLHRDEPPLPAAKEGVKGYLAKFIDRCLEKDPEERWQTTEKAYRWLYRKVHPPVWHTVARSLLAASIVAVPSLYWVLEGPPQPSGTITVTDQGMFPVKVWLGPESEKYPIDVDSAALDKRFANGNDGTWKLEFIPKLEDEEPRPFDIRWERGGLMVFKNAAYETGGAGIGLRSVKASIRRGDVRGEIVQWTDNFEIGWIDTQQVTISDFHIPDRKGRDVRVDIELGGPEAVVEVSSQELVGEVLLGRAGADWKKCTHRNGAWRVSLWDLAIKSDDSVTLVAWVRDKSETARDGLAAGALGKPNREWAPPDVFGQLAEVERAHLIEVPCVIGELEVTDVKLLGRQTRNDDPHAYYVAGDIAPKLSLGVNRRAFMTYELYSKEGDDGSVERSDRERVTPGPNQLDLSTVADRSGGHRYACTLRLKFDEREFVMGGKGVVENEKIKIQYSPEEPALALSVHSHPERTPIGKREDSRLYLNHESVWLRVELANEDKAEDVWGVFERRISRPRKGRDADVSFELNGADPQKTYKEWELDLAEPGIYTIEIVEELTKEKAISIALEVNRTERALDLTLLGESRVTNVDQLERLRVERGPVLEANTNALELLEADGQQVHWRMTRNGKDVDEGERNAHKPFHVHSEDELESLAEGEYELHVKGKDRYGNSLQIDASPLAWTVASRGPKLVLETPGSVSQWEPTEDGLEVVAKDDNGVADVWVVVNAVGTSDLTETFHLERRENSDTWFLPSTSRQFAFDRAWSRAQVGLVLHAHDESGYEDKCAYEQGEGVGWCEISPVHRYDLPPVERYAPARVELSSATGAPMGLVRQNKEHYVLGGRSDSKEQETFDADERLDYPYHTKRGSGDRGWKVDYEAKEIPDFYLDRYEVTEGEFHAFLHATDTEHDHEAFDADDAGLPVTGVSFGEASAYARWVKKRLPTLLEWEYAVRSRFGSDPSAYLPYAGSGDWYPHHGKLGAEASSRDRVKDEGSLADDSPAVRDLSGNVAEWTSTGATFMHQEARNDREALVGEEDETDYWVVGGSYASPRIDFLSTYMPLGRDVRRPDVGFRCAIDAERVLDVLESPDPASEFEVVDLVAPDQEPITGDGDTQQ